MIFWIMQTILGFSICTGNVLNLIIIHGWRSNNRLTRFLLSNIAVSDVIMGMAVLIRAIAMMAGMPNRYICPFTLVTLPLGLVPSFGTVAMLGWSFYYKVGMRACVQKRHSRQVFGIEAVIWVVSSIFAGIVPLVYESPKSEEKGCYISKDIVSRYYVMALFGLLLILEAVSLVMQNMTFRRLRNSLKWIPKVSTILRQNSQETQIESPDNPETKEEPPRNSDGALQKAGLSERSEAHGTTLQVGTAHATRHYSVIVAIISACMFICWTPTVLYVLLSAICPECSDFSAHETLPQILLAMGMLNSCMNVVVYSVKDKLFRQNALGLLSCKKQGNV